MGIEKLTPETKQVALERFRQLLKRATEKRASDVHLKVGLPPIVRVNGHLFYLGDGNNPQVSRLTAQELTDIIYSMMNPLQEQKYERGLEVDLGFETDSGRFRINICQQRSNPRLVCRYIPDSISTIKDLGLPPVVGQLALSSRGLILVTGSTGNGKSTTLAAMIDHITRTKSCHIITIEDPIEFVFKDRKSIVTQREIGLDTDDFTHALKYSLRQDPDVILVGEMRDEETILMALTAAETGHLVLSTLHTVDAGETINRILASVSPTAQAQVRMELASVIVGVISQRLLRRKDGNGRIAALEILVSNARIKGLISDPSKSTGDLRRVMEESLSMGMQSFDQSLMELYRQDLITKDEALAHCTNAQDFQLRVEGIVPGEWQQENGESSFPVHAKQAPPSIPVEIQLDRQDFGKKKPA